MIEKIQGYLSIAVNYLETMGILGGFVLVILESIIPILPLGVFITLNMMSFGKLLGLIISFFGTVTGCMLSFIIFRYFFRNLFYRIFREKTRIKVEKMMKKISNMDFNTLVLLLAMPFTPAFVINIAAGLSNMSAKKFLIALLISKIAIVYFWGYVGTNFVESLASPMILIKLIIIMLGAYIVSKIIEKIVKVEE